MRSTQTPAFSRPILASIYLFTGWFFIVMGPLAAALLFLTDGDMFDKLPLAGGLIIGSLSFGITLIGMAEMFSCIGRIAYHTEQIATLIAANIGSLSRPTAMASRAASPGAPRLSGISDSATASCPSCMAELDVRTLRKGSNRCPDCGVDFVAE